VVVLGLWIAVIGYGVAYVGVKNLGGQPCSFAQAFRGQCGTAPSSTPTGGRGGGPRPGSMTASAQLAGANYARQVSWLAQQRVIARRAGVP
jgi:hypothetical protein